MFPFLNIPLNPFRLFVLLLGSRAQSVVSEFSGKRNKQKLAAILDPNAKSLHQRSLSETLNGGNKEIRFLLVSRPTFSEIDIYMYVIADYCYFLVLWQGEGEVLSCDSGHGRVHELLKKRNQPSFTMTCRLPRSDLLLSRIKCKVETVDIIESSFL